MFSSRTSSSTRNRSHHDGLSTSRVSKHSKKKPSFSSSFRTNRPAPEPSSSPATSSTLNSPIVTVHVGPTQRLFAAHASILQRSPYLTSLISPTFLAPTPRIALPDVEPEVFSAVLEYLYKGDYSPVLVYSSRSKTWRLDGPEGEVETVYHSSFGGYVLKDTALYIVAEAWELPELKRLAFKKQGLRSPAGCGVVLSSARFAYERTEEGESRLRAHFLALIIRCRGTFERSGTMQMEMERGGRMWFDLFVALVNHLDDVQGGKS